MAAVIRWRLNVRLPATHSYTERERGKERAQLNAEHGNAANVCCCLCAFIKCYVLLIARKATITTTTWRKVRTTTYVLTCNNCNVQVCRFATSVVVVFFVYVHFITLLSQHTYVYG